jgi:two-component system, cell cycle sensor histidine kinase and response regulator CckA
MRIFGLMIFQVAYCDKKMLIMNKISKGVRLNPEQSSACAAVERDYSEKTSAVKGRVLLMEEEPSIRNLIERMLAPKGFDIVCANDGAEAIELYKDAKARQRSFDAVILDLTVTFGMGAKETIKHLVAIDPDVKAIVSSGYSFDDAIVNYSHYGFKGAITKPFSIKELMSTVNEMIQNG